MSAGVYNDVIEQGANWILSVTKYNSDGANPDTPFDLTGFSARCQLRYAFASSAFTLTATCSIPEPLSGVIHVALTPQQTATIPDDMVRLLYDVEIFTANDVTVERVIEGSMTVMPNATRGS